MIFIHYPFLYKVLNYLTRVITLNSWSKNKFKSIISYKKTIDSVRIIDDSFIKYVQKKRNGLISKSNDIETLAIRGSYVDYGFYAPLLMNAYNLGLTSHDLYGAYYLFHNLVDGLPNLNKIVIYYSVFTSGLNLSKTNEKYRMIVYNYFFNIPLPEEINLEKRYVKYLNKKCLEIDRNSGEKIDDNYWGYDKKSYYMSASADLRVKTHLRENKREQDQLDWLIKLAEESNAKDIELYIVLPPFREDYKKLLPTKNELYEKLFRIKFPVKTRILDYHDSTLFEYSDFGDTDHLNENGAIKLTKDLEKTINNYIH